MLKAQFEPNAIDIFHKIEAGQKDIPAGAILMKTGADTVKVSDGTAVWGVLSQDVYVNPGNKYPLPYNNHEAYDGDYVGIYHSGFFTTDQFEEGDYAPGADLYVSENGKFTSEAGEDSVVIGKVINKNGKELFLKLG